MARKKKIWRFTEGRKQALRKAQKEHQVLVELGKKARARGMK
ncbi:MAG: hypothetical protein PHQ86_07705 [Dehalococcoidales bacterium]|jgi:hypothetical protein|nr:hypothetical protein [Dehalococcoidales bacterium]